MHYDARLRRPTLLIAETGLALLGAGIVAVILLPWVGRPGLEAPLAYLALWASGLVAAFLTASRERHPVWPFEPEGPSDVKASELADEEFARETASRSRTPTPARLAEFAGREGVAAARLGFRPLGRFRRLEEGAEDVRSEIWRSEGGETLAVVSSGVFAGWVVVMDLELSSRTEDGHLLVTRSDPIAAEVDLTGVAREWLLEKAGFEPLLAWHRMRIAGRPLVPYAEDDPLGDHREVLRERADRLVARADARHLDPERSTYRYTPKAAVVLAIRLYARQLRRLLLPDRILLRHILGRRPSWPQECAR